MPLIPDFTSPAFQQSHSNVQLRVSILEGKDRMPANRSMVSDALAGELVGYVRSFGPAAPIETTPTEAASGAFDVEFDKLAKQFNDLQRQERELATAPAPVSVPPASAVPAGVAGRGPAPAADRLLTGDDAARGRELFLGLRRLANGGPACVTCHAASGDGGRLGPDLTKVYERAGGRQALIAHLWASATPTMQPVYQRRALEQDEVLALAAYLEETDKQGVEQAAGPPRNFLLLGLGGAVLGLAVVSAFCRGRSPAGSRPGLNGTAAAGLRSESEFLPLGSEEDTAEEMAVPAAREGVAQVPADYVAPGL
jgi:mono/diheme cytochrome c family protein